MMAPAVPPTTAPMMAPVVVEPRWCPMTPPTTAPAPAPITAPSVSLGLDAHAASDAAAMMASTMRLL